MTLKDEVAGVLAILAVCSLVVGLAGLATLLGAALGNGGPLGAVAGAVATTAGAAGVLAVWGVVASGYFEPATPDGQPSAGTRASGSEESEAVETS